MLKLERKGETEEIGGLKKWRLKREAKRIK